MIHPRTDAAQKDWVRRVRDSLRARGYYYEPGFHSETCNARYVVAAARLLGPLYVPPDTDSDRPVVLTRPSLTAPPWRPFDRRAAIGWHNDFSTRSGRPELSLSWIRRGDPAGPTGGAWRVASASAVLAKLRQTREGTRLATELSERAEAFGYRDAGRWYPFRVVAGAYRGSDRRGLRFYGRALEEGARLRFGKVPDRTREIVARIQGAADAVGEALPARTGALLIVDNRFSLHDRAEQQVAGPGECRRQAWLCFVKRLHEPL
jgi:hypothetical protein